MIELKPCPFCGGEAKAVLGRGNCAVVFCGAGCPCEMRSEINIGKYQEITYEELDDAFTRAAAKWNTRCREDVTGC